MPSFNSLLDKIGETYHRVYQIEENLRRNPGDIAALAALNSIKSMASQLEEEWEQAAVNDRMEICHYRLVRNSSDNYSAAGVSNSLIGFQGVISHIYSALTEGPKHIARLSDKVKQESMMNLGFSYPGSFALALYVDSDKTIFGGRFDETIATLMNGLNINTITDVRNLAQNFGASVVRKIHHWSSSNLENDFNLSLLWINPDGVRKRDTINTRRWAKIVGLVESTSDLNIVEHEKIGMLVGIETAGSTLFHMYTSEGEYKGHLASNFDSSKQYTVNLKYKARISTESHLNYSSDEVVEKHTLLTLEVI